jgi:hypothetical protein
LNGNLRFGKRKGKMIINYSFFLSIVSLNDLNAKILMT